MFTFIYLIKAFAAELNNSEIKLNSASRSFQALKLEKCDKRYLMLHSIEAKWIWSFRQHLYLATIISTQSSFMK